MEEQEDEVGTMKSSSTSSWEAMEGSLQQSLKVVEDSEDALYTAGPTSKLVLAPPSQVEGEPCELTITFEGRQGHICQIYVLSSAHVCEIYGQKEQDGDREYICTVRGEIVSVIDEDLSHKSSRSSCVSPTRPLQDLTSVDNCSNTASVAPLAIPEVDLSTEMRHRMSQSELLGSVGKVDVSQPVDASPALTRKGSEEELFRSFTEAIPGRIVDESGIFEESLDQADWVECPHSPMKSRSSISGDEAEVDLTKSGFYFIDADVESQHSDHPHVRLFTDAISTSFDKNPSSLVLGGGDLESSGPYRWQEVTEDPNPKLNMTDVPLRQCPIAKKEAEMEPNNSPEPRSDQFGDDYAGEDVHKAGLCVFEVPGDCDSSSSSITSPTKGNVIAQTHDIGNQVAESSRLGSSAGKDGDAETRTMCEPPLSKCKVSLVNADAWTSVTIRLLSMKTKGQVKIHRVVVTYTPGPLIQLPLTSPSAPVQQSVGTSSLLAMLVPDILKMAHRLSEPRKVKKSAISTANEQKREPDGVLSPTLADKLGSPSQKLPTSGESGPAFAKVSSRDCVPPLMGAKDPNCVIEGKAFCLSGLTEGDTLDSAAVGGTHVSTRYGGEAESVIPRAVEFEENKKSEHIEDKSPGISEACKKEDDRVGELVQRFDRLETICLRMESSLHLLLENMDNRLKVLEAGNPARMPPALGHPIWGPGFRDSGSFGSATSVQLPTAQTEVGTASLMDPQVPFSPLSSVEVPVGESCPKSASPLVNFGLSQSLPSCLPHGWPENISPDLSSDSGLTASFISKSDLMNQSSWSLHNSEHPSIEGETYWESRESDDLESDVSSSLEQTSNSSNCEDHGCECFPVSLSLPPAKPVQLVDNALESALSAFSASFGAQNEVFCKDEVDCGEDSNDEDSFTSEEQVPLVDIDCFSSHSAKAEIKCSTVKLENAFMHDYDAIPLSIDKDMGDLNFGKLIQQENFWPPENGENQQFWQDEHIQIQEMKFFQAVDDIVHQTEGSATTFQASSGIFIHTSDDLCVDDSATQVILPADLDEVLPKNTVNVTAEDDDADTGLETFAPVLLQKSFLQEPASGGYEDLYGSQSGWLQQGWSGEQVETAKHVVSSYFSVRGLSKPLDSLEEILLQDGLFPDEWDWLTSEFSPFSSLMEVPDLPKDALADKEPLAPLVETLHILEESSPNISAGQIEPWSLLDENASKLNASQEIFGDMYGNSEDWLGQKSQRSLLDEDPPHVCGDTHAEEGFGDDCQVYREPRSLLDEVISIPLTEDPPHVCGDNHAEEGSGDDCQVYREPRSLLDEVISIPLTEDPPHVCGDDHADEGSGDDCQVYREPRSLLDEVISIPSGKLPAEEHSLPASLEDGLSLSNPIQSSEYTDASHSPSSQASTSNPFKHEHEEVLVLNQKNTVPLVWLGEFGEDVQEFVATEPKSTQSLLFHQSLQFTPVPKITEIM